VQQSWVGLSLLETVGEECIQNVQVGVHLEMACPVLGNFERGTESIGVSAIKVRGTLDASFCSLVPISKNRPFVGGIERVDAQRLRNIRKHIETRDIEPLFEERMTESETDGLARLHIFGIGGMGARKSWKGGLGKVPWIKPSEEVGSHLRSQILHMVGRSFWIKRCSVDEFKRPCPDVEKDIFTLQLSPTLNDTAESDMRKRTPYVCVDLDDLHISKFRWKELGCGCSVDPAGAGNKSERLCPSVVSDHATAELTRSRGRLILAHPKSIQAREMLPQPPASTSSTASGPTP
jgi:hypothetical protein